MVTKSRQLNIPFGLHSLSKLSFLDNEWRPNGIGLMLVLGGVLKVNLVQSCSTIHL